VKSNLTVVFGASGHGKVVCDILLASDIAVHGFIDNNSELHEKSVMGLPVLGSEDWIINKLKVEPVSVVLGIGKQQDRKNLADKLRKMGAEIITAIHPRATIAASAKLGQGTVIMAGAIVNSDVQMGRGVIINTGAIIEHDGVIGDYAHISPGAVTGGGVQVGSFTHIGLGAIVLPRVSVGSNSLVGAGSVVLKDIPDNVTAYGVPAKIQEKISV
jgi:sugar O-acyltransferase (sialic acid O-acetyltransferase NeuD family)